MLFASFWPETRIGKTISTSICTLLQNYMRLTLPQAPIKELYDTIPMFIPWSLAFSKISKAASNALQNLLIHWETSAWKNKKFDSAISKFWMQSNFVGNKEMRIPNGKLRDKLLCPILKPTKDEESIDFSFFPFFYRP